jgi:hypothetical protein
LYEKFLKSEFQLENVGFLGHVMLKNGIEVDLLKAIKKWPRPTIAFKIMSFMGLA